MPRIITKELAVRINAKLKGEKTSGKGAAHTEYAIEHEGLVIALTSIRHGSEKDLGHDHLSRDLHVGPNFAKQLGQCPKSREDYIQKLRDSGLIDDADAEEENGSKEDIGAMRSGDVRLICPTGI